MAAIDAVPVLLGAVTAVSLALSGVEGAALVAGALVLLGSASLLTLASVPLLRHGLRVAASESSRALQRRSPYRRSSTSGSGTSTILILGAQMSLAQVGFYWRVNQLGVEYQGR